MTLPKPPAHLSPDARRWWRGVVTAYELQPHQLPVLQAAAEAWDRKEQAREALTRDGLTMTTRLGEVKAHPAVAIERDSRVAYLRAVRELALDVSAPDSRPPALRGRYAGRP